MEKVETLMIDFLLLLRMNDIFDEQLYEQVKVELSENLDKYKNQEFVPKFLVPFVMDTFIALNAQRDISRHKVKISYAIDGLSAIIREKLC